MKVFHFDKNKYDIPVQMDLGVIEQTPVFFFEPEIHCTDFFEIMIFHRANGYVLLDTQRVDLQNGLFLFITPFQKRRWFVDRDKMKGHFLIFEKDFLNDFFSDHLFVYRLQYFFNQKVKPYFLPNKRLFSFEGDIFEEIFHEIQNYQKDSPHLLRSIVYYILIKLNREFCKFHKLESETQLNNFAYQFKEALENNIREKQQVNDYAQLLGTSRVTLNQLIKRQFGMTVSEMIRERLITEIKNELLYTTRNISEIAYELHFSEVSNLNRFFKSKTGYSPNTFRATYQID